MFRIIGHRGAAGYALENSMAGFRKAQELGVGHVEFDIQLTADRVPVVFHDKRLDRTTDARGYLGEKCYAWIRDNVRLINGEPIPGLEEVLGFLSTTNIKTYIEIVDSRADEGIQELVRRYLPDDRVVFSSFHPEVVRRIKAWNPSQRTMALFESAPPDLIALVRSAGAEEAGVAFASVSEKLVATLRQAGIDVLAWTVNDDRDMAYLESMGVSGVFTDFPAGRR